MGTINLRYLHRERTRHGREVWYVRVNDGPRVRITGEPGSAAFMAAYQAAIEKRPAPAPDRGNKAPGTLGWLILQYRLSAAFAQLAPATRTARGNILKRIDDQSGQHALSKINTTVIAAGRDRRSGVPESANTFVKTLRAVFKWAKAAGHVTTNPAADVELFRSSKTGFHTWSVEEVEQFRRHYPVGTKARLTMDILLFTGLRRSDAVRLGRQHIRNGVIEIRAQKNAAELTLPVLPALSQAIADGPCGDLTFIVSERGTPFGADSFTNWFRDRCREAGVPGSAHGLRKAAASIAAENGATEEQLKALFGWSSGRMAAIYTRAASRRRLALAGSAFMPGSERIKSADPRTENQSPPHQTTSRRKSDG